MLLLLGSEWLFFLLLNKNDVSRHLEPDWVTRKSGSGGTLSHTPAAMMAYDVVSGTRSA
jgi:hypothetical protein